MLVSEFLRIIQRYSRGKSSPAEEQVFDDFFNSFQREPDRLSLKPEAERLRIRSAIYAGIQGAKSQSRGVFIYNHVFRIAAAIALFVLAGVSVYWFTRDRGEFITYRNQRGERTEIVLEDGSVVKLNAESALTVPKKFNAQSRKILLTGEAFFEVRRDKDRPFTVASDNLLTTVVGTSFNIRSFPGYPASVSVITGRVKVNLREAKHGGELLLNPGEQAWLRDSLLEKRTIDAVAEASWAQGVLFFNDITMAEAAGMLERWYNVKVVFENESLKACYVKAKFKSEPLDLVLKSLSDVLDAGYVTAGDVVTLSGKGNCK